MSNTALTNHVEFEWLIQPSRNIPCYKNYIAEDTVSLRFKLDGPWKLNREDLTEWLLFTVQFVPLGSFAPQPAFALPHPHDGVKANAWTFIHHKEVCAGRDFISFKDIRITPGFPGFYQLQVSAFIATETNVGEELGHVLSDALKMQTLQETNTNAMQLNGLIIPPQSCPCCNVCPCSCWDACRQLPGCYFCTWHWHQ
jgi:hypothetical protein